VTLVFGPVGRHWSAFVFVITALGEITGLKTQKSMFERWRLTETEKILVPSFTQCAQVLAAALGHGLS